MDSQATRSVIDSTSAAGEHISNLASDARDKVSDLGRTAVGKVDDNRETAASGLQTAAATLHEKAEALPGGPNVSRVAHATADKLSATADYVRQNDVNTMMADLERLVKNNPGPSLLAAAIVGYLAGRTFTSRD
jgi:ElaB/YqjD/DUF883 family membrane-anchored ribosome-binding protein